jgi:hypothetical protein
MVSSKQYSKIISLHFSPEVVRRPMMYNLAKQFDLTFNILKARISPREEGHMILELSGKEEDYKKGSLISRNTESAFRMLPSQSAGMRIPAHTAVFARRSVLPEPYTWSRIQGRFFLTAVNARHAGCAPGSVQ